MKTAATAYWRAIRLTSPLMGVPARGLLRLALLLCLISLNGCSLQRMSDALLVLGDLAAGAGPSRLKDVTAPPSRVSITYMAGGTRRSADLYLPGEGSPRAGIVLVPGAVPKGKDDPRLVAIAMTLARVRFAVLTPELTGYRERQIRPDHVSEIRDAFRSLSERRELSPGGRAGIGAFSYAVGPAILAALDENIRRQVKFVLGVGGYYDLRAAIRFFTTGYFDDAGVQRYLRPDDYGKLVFAKTALEYLSSPSDRVIIEAMVEAKLRDSAADITPLAAGLGPEGLSVYRLLMNTDASAAPALIAALPAPILATIDALTLEGKDLTRLKARLILVHGRNDPLVPYSETLKLARAAERSHARVFILHHILAHVELTFGRVFSRRFWSEDLPDAWRLYRAVSLLLSTRSE
ncbi:MAG: alpha/beta hydrolase family protein [Burkholderiales bacterium]